MALASVLSGAPFRTALLALAVFVPALALIGATLHHSLGEAMLGELETEVLAELVLLRDIAERGGNAALVDAVRRMEQSGASAPRLTGLFDSTGTRLAGDLDIAPSFLGWRTLGFEHRVASADGDTGVYRTRVERWRRSTLVVGRSTRLIERAQDALVRDLLVAGALVTALCLAIGYALSRRSRDKLARLADVLDRVSLGESGARLPIGRTSDQIDRVARQMNGHLERLSTLMASLRNTAGAIAHDLRTPLARASVALQGIRLDDTLDERHAAALDDAVLELDELGDIIETVLRIARIEASADEHEWRTFPIGPLVAGIGEMFAPVAEENGQFLEVRAGGGEAGCGGQAVPRAAAGRRPGDAPDDGSRARDECLVRGDERMLRRMLANLVENAIRHAPSGARIRLESKAPEGAAAGVSLVVEDDGPGIAAAERERVLEPFARLDASRTTPGTGLGLALVAAVARRHGAQLLLEDAVPGLRVSVRFPPAG